jgi:RNA polymerase sigma-70 factor (ECF subfamily)
LRLTEALGNLPVTQRDAILLRHFQGLSLADIAKELECTPAAVAGLLQRGLKNLRASLTDEGES